MSDKKIFIVCGTIVLCVACLSVYSYNRSIIEAEKSVKEAEIQAATDIERTEERSQFWQKLVPWGQDEEE